MNVTGIIEHLEELGKVIVPSNAKVYKLIRILEKYGYYTHFESSDRDYLILDGVVARGIKIITERNKSNVRKHMVY